MRFARVAAVAASIGFGWFWIRSESVRPIHEPATARVPGTRAVAPAPSPAAAKSAAEVAPAAPHAASFPDPSGDLALYADHPMSSIPHRVVRGWGLGPRSRRPGYIGVLIVVDPGIDRESLESLVRDIRAYHRDAEALAVRVLDSLEAATYDRHEDGGALLAESVIATVHYSEQLELDETKVHGALIDAGSDAEDSSDDVYSAGGSEAPSDPGESGST